MAGRGALRLALAALVLATTWVAGPAVAGPTSNAQCRLSHDGAWTKLGHPSFATGPHEIQRYAVSPDASAVYVTNGSVVLRSTDSGCHWKSVYSAQSTVGASATVERVLIPASGTGTVYVATAHGLASLGTASTTVSVSDNSGGSWTSGAKLPGRLVDLASGSQGTHVLYALTDEPVDDRLNAQGHVVRVLSRSTDDGHSWKVEQASGPVTTSGLIGTGTGLTDDFEQIAVDPVSASRIWLSGRNGIRESHDGGTTLTSPASALPSDGTQAVVAGATARRHAQIAYDLPTLAAIEYTRPAASDPDSLAVVPAGAPTVPVTSIVLGPLPGQLAASDGQHVLLQFPPSALGGAASTTLFDVSPAHARLADLASATTGSHLTVFGRTPAGLERRMMPDRPRLPGPIGQAPQFRLRRPNQKATLTVDTSALRRAHAPTISPRHVRLALTVGQHRVMPYRLALPASRKVDVYFLVDISNSMADKIRGLKLALDGIIRQLHTAGIDAWFGIGEYRSYDDQPAYERVLDISPPGRQLLDKLANLPAAGGGNETQLAALYQTATGAGQNDPNAFIAAGQQAHFRPDALHLVLNATDEGFSAGAQEPSYDEAARALRGVDAKQIGIAYETQKPVAQLLSNPTFTPNPSTGEMRMARLTGAFAPPEGADCNGDRQPDIAPGQPLVCIVDPAVASEASAIAPAIVNMILAAPDFAKVTVTWAAKRPVIRSVTPQVAPAVNLRYPTALTFNVTYNCPRAIGPGVYPAMITAHSRGAVIAQARANIDCGAPVAAAAAAPLAAVGFGTAPAPPAEPVTNAQVQGQPQGQPQSQPQSQPQAQAQAGAAYQEQEDPQFAFAYSNASAESDPSLSFSRYRPPAPGSPPAPPPTIVALAVSTVAGFSLFRIRRRTQHVAATIRRSRTRR